MAARDCKASLEDMQKIDEDEESLYGRSVTYVSYDEREYMAGEFAIKEWKHAMEIALILQEENELTATEQELLAKNKAEYDALQFY